jgi:hypothetical protein
MKFVKVSISATSLIRKEVALKVSKGELKLSHFAIDGDDSYHYYEIRYLIVTTI